MGDILDVKVTGAEQFADLARKLKAQGEAGKGLRKELYKAFFRATKPVKEDVRKSWANNLPASGGMNKKKLSVTTRARAGGRWAGVRILSKSPDKYDVNSIDRGRLRHPVFGNRKVWANTSVEPGIITKPQEESAPAVREQIIRAIEDIARRVEG